MYGITDHLGIQGQVEVVSPAKQKVLFMASIKWKFTTILIIKVDKQLNYYISSSFPHKDHATGN